jgi:starch phosphorylase
VERFLDLGRRAGAEPQEPFSMAISAMQSSAFRNAVSRLHREVSQEMWEGLWPNLPVWEVPIAAITNGVHLTSWINGDLASLYDQYLQPDWREGHAEPEVWNQTADIPVTELWDAHRRRKRRLVAFVRERVAAAAAARNAPAAEIERAKEVLDPDAFTIGFARRFATYKRATLVFKDLERLKKILLNEKMPVQIVIAGKAHPKDLPGKTLIREIVHFSRDPELAGRVVFVEDYGIEVAGELVQGVDLWLNTPRRGEEACGTSGMKADVNGVLNMSILDGWFDEAAEHSGGWAIGDRQPYSPDRDDAHASSIYSLLEHEIAPLFYEGREHGVPMGWMRRVRQCLRYVSTNFNCQRMIGEYNSEFYEPAHRKWEQVSRDGFAAARAYVSWADGVARKWSGVTFRNTEASGRNTEASGRNTEESGSAAGSDGAAFSGIVLNGAAIPLRAGLDLAGLTPADVRVEAVVGRLGPRGELVDTQVLTLDPLEQQGNHYLFGKEFVPLTTGRLGYAVRVTPNHSEDPLNRPCNTPFKWMNR